MLTLTKVPQSAITIGNATVYIDKEQVEIRTKVGPKTIDRYIMFAKCKNGGWKICDAKWDRIVYAVPSITFSFLDAEGKWYNWSNPDLSAESKKRVAHICDEYDKTLALMAIEAAKANSNATSEIIPESETFDAQGYICLEI